MKCPKCDKEGFRFVHPKHLNKEGKEWFRINEKKECKKCGYKE